MDAKSTNLIEHVQRNKPADQVSLHSIVSRPLSFNKLSVPKTEVRGLKVSATLKIAIFPYLRFQRFQIGMLESFHLKKNQKKILFLSKDIGGKRFFLVNYLY